MRYYVIHKIIIKSCAYPSGVTMSLLQPCVASLAAPSHGCAGASIVTSGESSQPPTPFGPLPDAQTYGTKLPPVTELETTSPSMRISMLPPAVRGSVHDTSVAVKADAVTLLAKKAILEQATPPTVIVVDSLKFEPVMSRVLLPPSMGHTEELQDVLVSVTIAGSTVQDCSLAEPCASTDFPRGHFVQFSSEMRPTAMLNVPAGHKSQPKSDVRPGVPLHFPFEHLPVHFNASMFPVEVSIWKVAFGHLPVQLLASVRPVDASSWCLPAGQPSGHAFASEVWPTLLPNRPMAHADPTVHAFASDVCPVALA